MAWRYGRGPRGQRLRASVPHGHWKTTTFVAGLRLTGISAPFALDGPSTGAPSRPIWPGCSSRTPTRRHRGHGQPVQPQGTARARADRGGGCKPALPPALQPDFNPIENAFAKLKALLRRTAARTVDALWTAIGCLVDALKPAECTNYFAAAGYDAPERNTLD